MEFEPQARLASQNRVTRPVPNKSPPSSTGGDPGDTGRRERADGDHEFQERVEEWFLLKGVPLFVSIHRTKDFIPFAFPLLAVTLAFELVTLPWLRFDGVRPDPTLGLLLNVAAVVVVLALLFPTLPLFRALVRPVKEPASSAPHADKDWRGRLSFAVKTTRAAVGVAARLAPLGVIVVLLLARRLVPAEIGWEGIVDLGVMFGVLTAMLMLWLARAGSKTWPDVATGGVLLLLALGLAAVDPTADLPEETFPRRVLTGITALLLVGYAYFRLRRRQPESEQPAADEVAPALLIACLVFAFEAELAPWLAWGPELHRAGMVALVAMAVAILWAQAAHAERITRAVRIPPVARMPLGLVLFLALPVVFALLLEEGARGDSTVAAILVANVLALLLLLTSAAFGMHHVADWVWRECWQQTRHTFAYFWSIGASVLLVFVFFTFFTNEIWQIARHDSERTFWLLIAAFPIVATVLLLVRIPNEIAARNRFEQWCEIKECASPSDTSRELMDDKQLPDGKVESSLLELGPGEKLNLALVLLVKQVLRTIVVGALVMGVLVLIGLATITNDVLEAWDVLTSDEAGLRWDLIVRVSAFLGAFCSFFFVANSMKDPASRTASFADVDDEITRRLAMRAAYLKRFQPTEQTDHATDSLGWRVLRRPGSSEALPAAATNGTRPTSVA